MILKIRRQSILKYLHQFNNPKSINRKCIRYTLSGECTTFDLSSFDEFTNSYKTLHQPPLEILDAFDHFLPALNEFLDLYGESTGTIIENTIIIVDWYNSATISSRDIIRAISQYYHNPQFDNVAINMDIEEADMYNTDDGACFAKVVNLINYMLHILKSNTNNYLFDRF